MEHLVSTRGSQSQDVHRHKYSRDCSFGRNYASSAMTYLSSGQSNKLYCFQTLPNLASCYLDTVDTMSNEDVEEFFSKKLNLTWLSKLGQNHLMRRFQQDELRQRGNPSDHIETTTETPPKESPLLYRIKGCSYEDDSQRCRGVYPAYIIGHPDLSQTSSDERKWKIIQEHSNSMKAINVSKKISS